MTVKIKVINNKNKNMKHKDNNLQIPITLNIHKIMGTLGYLYCSANVMIAR